MSLLNEMLHDLAKQKDDLKKLPLLSITHATNTSQKVANSILILLVFIAIALFSYLISQQMPKSATKVSTVSTDVASVLPAIPPVVVKNEIAFSFIEPIDSPASEYASNQVEKDLIGWENNQDLAEYPDIQEQATNAVVKKVYAPLSTEEWHNVTLNKALKAIDEGQDEVAIQDLQSIIQKIPEASDARENLAILYLYYKDYAGALKTVDDGLKYDSSNIALVTIKARILVYQGNNSSAIKLLSQFKPPMTSYPDYYGTLAAALQSEGKIAESGNIYKALLQIEPQNGQYWLGLGIALEHNKQTNQAIEAYAQASQNPDIESSVREYAEDRLKTLQG